MERRVLKYNLYIENDFSIELPVDYAILDIQPQDGVPKLWVSGRLDVPKIRERFHCVGTGEHIDSAWQYLATVLCGNNVWHFYRW